MVLIMNCLGEASTNEIVEKVENNSQIISLSYLAHWQINNSSNHQNHRFPNHWDRHVYANKGDPISCSYSLIRVLQFFSFRMLFFFFSTVRAPDWLGF